MIQLRAIRSCIIHTSIKSWGVISSCWISPLRKTELSNGSVWNFSFTAKILIVEIKVICKIFQKLDLSIPLRIKLWIFVKPIQYIIPKPVMRLRILFGSFRRTIFSIIIRIYTRNHLLRVHGIDMTAPIITGNTDFLIGNISRCTSSNPQPVGNVRIQVHTPHIAIISRIFHDTRIIYIGKAHWITCFLLLAIEWNRMFLHPLLRINLIPPVCIGISYIVRITRSGNSIRISFSCFPKINRTLRKHIGVSQVIRWFIHQFHILDIIRNCMNNFERFIIWDCAIIRHTNFTLRAVFGRDKDNTVSTAISIYGTRSRIFKDGNIGYIRRIDHTDALFHSINKNKRTGRIQCPDAANIIRKTLCIRLPRTLHDLKARWGTAKRLRGIGNGPWWHFFKIDSGNRASQVYFLLGTITNDNYLFQCLRILW